MNWRVCASSVRRKAGSGPSHPSVRLRQGEKCETKTFRIKRLWTKHLGSRQLVDRCQRDPVLHQTGALEGVVLLSGFLQVHDDPPERPTLRFDSLCETSCSKPVHKYPLWLHVAFPFLNISSLGCWAMGCRLGMNPLNLGPSNRVTLTCCMPHKLFIVSMHFGNACA